MIGWFGGVWTVRSGGRKLWLWVRVDIEEVEGGLKGDDGGSRWIQKRFGLLERRRRFVRI